MSDDTQDKGVSYNQITEAEGAREAEREWPIGEAMANDVSAIYDIPVQISAVLGRSTMQVSQLLKLGRGAVVELDRKVGEGDRHLCEQPSCRPRRSRGCRRQTRRDHDQNREIRPEPNEPP